MLNQVIRSTPDWMQKPIRNIYERIPIEKRLGKDFFEMYDFLQKSQWWTKQQFEEYQMLQLGKLLKHAYENVPYYRKVFDERGLKPNDIQNFNDMKHLPYLTKEIVQENIKDMIAKNYSTNSISYRSTSGSTGTPLGIYFDNKADAKEWAFITRQWARVGYDINKKNRCVVLRGNVTWRGNYEYNGNNLILSSYHLSEINIKEYIRRIEDFNPNFIQAYPSSISILSDYIIRNNIKVNVDNLKSIICGSENLYDFQRKMISSAFNKRVYSFYGQTEQVCLAGECEQSSFYHLNSEYGITEIIDKDGKDVTEEDAIGEIVATGFNNYVVPLIRYKTMDLAVYSNKQCICNRKERLIKKVEGRVQDFIINSKNEIIICDMLTASIHDNTFDNVKEFQFYQDTPGICILFIVKRENYSKKDEKKIYNKLGTKLGNYFTIKIKYIDAIERMKSGKYKFLIQKLKTK